MENTDIKTQRFNEMDKAGKVMVEETGVLAGILENYKIFENDPLADYCLDFLRQKSGNKPLRAYFIQKIYEYLNHYSAFQEQFDTFPDKDLFDRKLPFVFEVVIVIQYLHNQILDEKYDAKKFNHPKICQNLISSNILRELLFLYLEQEVAPKLRTPSEFQCVKSAVRKLLLWVDIGQRVDKNYNHFDHWKAGGESLSPQASLMDTAALEAIIPWIQKAVSDMPEKEAFVNAYFQRIYLTNVYFFRCMTECVLDLLQDSSEHYPALQRFSIQYGFMLQIINDYADFAYTEDKDKQEELKTSAKASTDFFSDLYNFNITLPLMYHLKEGGRRNIESYLEGRKKRKKLLNIYPRQIMMEIVQSGGIDAAVRMSRELSKAARECLELDNPVSPFLTNMCDMALKNKFYSIFKS